MARIVDLLGAHRPGARPRGTPTLSFEFFPPADDDADRRLQQTLDELGVLAPSFVSVTCGVGGDGHDRTRSIVAEICGGRPVPVMAHVTCVGHTRSDIAALLDDYAALGVGNILALAGDPPDGSAISGDFRYAAELVQVVRDHPAGFSVGVAAHPEVHPRSADRASDRRHLAAKLGAADFAVTQFFFDAEDYTRLGNELADLGCHQPVIPGVMPVIWPRSVRRYAAMNGTTVPEALFDRLDALAGDDRVAAAADAAAELARDLLAAGAPGIHLYTLNRSEASIRIAELLDL
ncbi:methylenetetrahydrofolate reductase [Candidatus Poriferisocius sp.]|uniref:methylenetetrahydrofolate reductase n=1 Tax=Candidatus Poriferisocius sp. TaxID=3101276 RepID=UPI003B58C4E5